MSLDRSEIARYLGYGGEPLTKDAEALASACERELREKTAPRSTARRMRREGLHFRSRDLERHIKGTDEVWLAAVTLGSEADRLLRIWSVENMAKAAVGQACCAVLMDELMDKIMQELKKKMPENEYLLPAFSPGYGDFALEDQQYLLNLLNAGRRIGVSLTSGGMLVPEKSITAVIGITHKPAAACRAACVLCGKKNCKFRKGNAE